ncbi:GNAT family N-acetyltransferase [Bacilliculturomica massiliensis]|uniref:GNAT family N-acetyltransferase n=1 Tax=Bacilliculturomica massiliensis TaxID=1917867 RepID=UPI00103247DA|nr:GNAT family N-acetyltransferase [Bacilliculturomica massiliensis]
MVVKLIDTKRAEPLFRGWQETAVWSCLQNVMGEIYCDNGEKPVSAAAMIGDFSFLAGTPDEEMLRFCPEWRSGKFAILVPQNSAWAEFIESSCGEQVRKVTRYALKKEPDVFDRGHLRRAAASLPASYTFRPVDEELYRRCLSEEWSRDLVSLYRDYGDYRSWGLGVAVMHGEELAAGASSYSSYQGGIEIEIDTRLDHRRKGLAFACGAKLILECLDRGLYPSWDAQNLWSLALAKKLGYHFEREYPAYEITD